MIVSKIEHLISKVVEYIEGVMNRRENEFNEIRSMLHKLDHDVHHIEHHLNQVERNVLHLLRILKQQHQQLTDSISIIFSGDQMPSTKAVTLNVGQTSQATVQPFLADGVTPSGGVVSAVTFTFSDPSATVVLNADGVTATVTGVADSAGAAVGGSVSATVTDTDGAASTWNQAFTVTTVGSITPPPPSQLTQSVAVSFSDPA